MFSQVSVCSQGRSAPLHAGLQHPLGRHPPWADTPPGQTHPWPVDTPWADTPLGGHQPPAQCMLEYSQQAGGTHLTGMHSCLRSVHTVLVRMRLRLRIKDIFTHAIHKA